MISLIMQRNLATKIWAMWESGLTAVWLKRDPPVMLFNDLHLLFRCFTSLFDTVVSEW